MSWFDKPPPQPRSRWDAFTRGWVRWWSNYWGVPIAAFAAAGFIWIIVGLITSCCDPNLEPEPTGVYRVYEVEFEDRQITCIRLDAPSVEGFDCDWD